MEKDILEKLKSELVSSIDTEPKVLYFLAEIRKYIDRCSKEEKNKYTNLYFYCNWVLHIEMDKSPAQKILERFNQFFAKINDLDVMSSLFIKREKNFYYFIDLKRELLGFFKMNNLPIELLKNKLKWDKFIKLLVEILIDCPLINKNGRVEKFFYERGEDKQIRFRIKIKNLGSFKITLKEKEYFL